MNQHEKHLHDLLHHADMETVEQISAEFPAADDTAKERIYQNILNARQTQHSADMIREELIPVVRRSRYRNVWAAAACLLICGGIIGTAAIHRPETHTENAGTTSRIDTAETKPEAEETVYSAQDNHAAAQQETNASLKIQPETTAAFPMETTIVTVIADETVQTEAQPEQETQAATSVQQVFTAILPETAPIQTVTETIPAETQAAESAPQNTFAFIPLADQIPAVSGFTFTAFESEWGQKCSFAISDTSNRKHAVQERYEATCLPEGWEYHSTNDPNGSYESDTAQGIQWYVYETFYEMTAAADNGEPLTDFYLIVRQHAKDQELLCKQEYVLGANGMQVPENPSLYAYAETTVNGNPAFIYREDHPSVEDTRSIWYTLYWKQDGYLFSIFTGDVPESYLLELIRTAESVQMIG